MPVALPLSYHVIANMDGIRTHDPLVVMMIAELILVIIVVE